jgi:hypothetical protein
MPRARVTTCVTSQRIQKRGDGIGLLAFCEGIIESRYSGRPCVFVNERKRTRGCENMLGSIACCGLHIRHPRVHGPAVTGSYLPAVESTTENRTVYL